MFGQRGTNMNIHYESAEHWNAAIGSGIWNRGPELVMLFGALLEEVCHRGVGFEIIVSTYFQFAPSASWSLSLCHSAIPAAALLSHRDGFVSLWNYTLK